MLASIGGGGTARQLRGDEGAPVIGGGNRVEKRLVGSRAFPGELAALGAGIDHVLVGVGDEWGCTTTNMVSQKAEHT